MKVFLLGFDGLTLKIVEPYVQKDLLPNFKKIIDGGSHGILYSTIPPITGPAWTSLSTGKNPGKHGVFNFTQKNGYKTDFITKNTCPHAEPLWDILSRNGKHVTILNVPFTYPPDEVNGIMVSGLMTPDEETEFVFPKELKEEIFKIAPNYRIDVQSKEHVISGSKKLFVKDIFKVTEERRKIMNHLMENYPWDLFYVTFIGTDRLQHFYWNEIVSFKPECIKYYELIDNILGDILKNLNDDILIVVSDHGFMNSEKSFHINNFLKDSGLLHLREDQKNKNKESLATGITKIILGKLILLGMLRMKTFLPEFIKSHLKKSLFKNGISGSEIDWKKTKAFSLIGYGMIFINLKGRELEGIIENEDYQSLCDRLKKELLAFKDPVTNKNIIKNVFLGMEIYTCEFDICVPDLVVIMHEGYSIKDEIGEEIISDHNVGNLAITGDHDLEGIFIAYGNNIINKKINAKIYDIMPTILYLMGMEVPEDVDGQILTEIIKDDFLKKTEIKFKKKKRSMYSEDITLNENEKKLIEKQLRDLGYIG